MVSLELVQAMAKQAMARVIKNDAVYPQDAFPGHHMASRLHDRSPGGAELSAYRAKELESDVVEALQRAGGKNLHLGNFDVKVPIPELEGGVLLSNLDVPSGSPGVHRASTFLGQGMHNTSGMNIEQALEQQMGRKGAKGAIKTLRQDLSEIAAKHRLWTGRPKNSGLKFVEELAMESPKWRRFAFRH